MVAEPTDPGAFTDAWEDRSAIPYTDETTTALIDNAVEVLLLIRSLIYLRDAAATISMLVSLIAEADARLADAVADARDLDYSWDTIADRLATTMATARRRYAGYVRARKPPELD
jgi:hypothetical protein